MYTALQATSVTLKKLLTDQIQAELADPTIVVELLSPMEMQNSPGEEKGISLWLYRVERDPERLNDPPLRVDDTHRRYTPLPLRLHYLVTPIVGTSAAENETEQKLLGKVLQIFHDHPLISGADLQGDFTNTTTELRVRLEPMTLEETARLRDMLKLEAAYELAVSYEVSVVYIASQKLDEVIHPVQIAEPEYGLIHRVTEE